MKTAKHVDLCSELAAALQASPAALKNFAAMPPSHQREYNKYVAEAKKAETRSTRAEKVLPKIKAWHKR